MNTITTSTSKEMEIATLCAMMINKNAIFEVRSLLEPEMFSDPDLRWVCQAIFAIHDQGISPDYYLINDQLHKTDPERFAKLNGLLFLRNELQRQRNADQVVHYATSVLHTYVLNRFKALCMEWTDGALQANANIHALIEIVQSNIFSMGELLQGESRSEAIGVIARKVVKELRYQYDHPDALRKQFIPSGIAAFDSLTGGLARGSAVVLGARPSMGKTAISLHIATRAALAGYAVCIYSLEMTEMELAQRILSGISQVDASKLRHKGVSLTELAMLDKATEKLRDCPLEIDYATGLTMEQIRMRTRLKARQGKCDIVIIDHLQEVREPEVARNKQVTADSQTSASIKQAKQLAMEINGVAIINCQLNRDCEKRPPLFMPQLSDLRNSGSIEQTADQVIFIYRPEQYKITKDPNTDESLIGIGNLIVAKNRNGEKGTIKFRYNAALTEIKAY